MKIVNMTAQEIIVRLPDCGRVYPPSGQVVSWQVLTETWIDALDGVPTILSSFGALEGLPSMEPGVIYLTSTPAAQKAASLGRLDVLSPDTGPTAIRNEKGQVVAVTRFQRF